MSQPIVPIFVPTPTTPNFVNGDLEVGGDAQVDGNLTVKGIANIGTINLENVSTNGNLQVGGTTQLTGNVTINGELLLPHIQSGTGTLVSLALNTSNEVVVGSESGGGTVSSVSTSDSNLVLTPDPIITTGTIAIASHPSFSGLTTTGTTSLASTTASSLTVTGGSSFSTVSASGASTMAGISATGLTMTGAIASGTNSITAGPASFSTLSASGTSTLAGVSATGLTMSGAIASGTNSISAGPGSFSTLSASGASTLAGVSATGLTMTGAIAAGTNSITGGAGSFSTLVASGASSMNAGLTVKAPGAGTSSSQLTVVDATNTNYVLHIGPNHSNAQSIIQSQTLTVGFNNLALNPLGGSVTTFSNTLDNGSGGSSFGSLTSGSLTSTGALTVNGNSQLGTASGTNTVHTSHNVLDDGSGNATFTGNALAVTVNGSTDLAGLVYFNGAPSTTGVAALISDMSSNYLHLLTPTFAFANINVTLPSNNGTLALLSDIPATPTVPIQVMYNVNSTGILSLYGSAKGFSLASNTITFPSLDGNSYLITTILNCQPTTGAYVTSSIKVTDSSGNTSIQSNASVPVGSPTNATSISNLFPYVNHIGSANIQLILTNVASVIGMLIITQIL
jgi:hypothetical protein